MEPGCNVPVYHINQGGSNVLLYFNTMATW
jgi:hypothetical protein